MPKRTSKTKRPKRPEDVNQLAHELVRESTGEVETAAETISRIMREMGHKGGKIGGKRKMETMTDEERSQAAHNAAVARWAKRKKL